jgi:hypothetical protein
MSDFFNENKSEGMALILQTFSTESMGSST